MLAGPDDYYETQESAEVFAEAESADALLERDAAAAEQAVEEGFELEGADDV
jgi:hypothetical protein